MLSFSAFKDYVRHALPGLKWIASATPTKIDDAAIAVFEDVLNATDAASVKWNDVKKAFADAEPLLTELAGIFPAQVSGKIQYALNLMKQILSMSNPAESFSSIV